MQLLGDGHGNLIHLGERDSSVQRTNQKIVTETPAPYLDQEQRQQLWRDAIEIARLFGCRSACTVEFVIDSHGQWYFTEIKARIQVEHAVSEVECRRRPECHAPCAAGRDRLSDSTALV